MIKGLIHLNHILNFGTFPSPGIFGRVANAMFKILLQCGIEAVIKWVDDCIFIHYLSCHQANGTYEFTYLAELVWNITEELGWAWAPVKFVDFSMAFTYIGFQWDLSAKVVELPKKKKAKYLKWMSM